MISSNQLSNLYYIYKHNNCDDLQYWIVEEQKWSSNYSDVVHSTYDVCDSIANIIKLEELEYFVCIGKILPNMEPDPYFLGILVD